MNNESKNEEKKKTVAGTTAKIVKVIESHPEPERRRIVEALHQLYS